MQRLYKGFKSRIFNFRRCLLGFTHFNKMSGFEIAFFCRNDLFLMIIRKYQITDTEMIMNLFYNTVHEINIRDYSQAQVDAWATKNLNYEYWLARLKIKQPFVAEINGEIVGFVELEADGHIDCFYCHSQYQNQGIGTQLLNHIEDIAQSQNNQKLYSEVSITAKPFSQTWVFNY